MCIHKGDFIIFRVSTGWIVYNKHKKFAEGHTHLRNKQSALALVDFAVKEKMPRRCGFYYLISLTRISENPKFVEKVLSLVDVRKGKGKKQSYHRK